MQNSILVCSILLRLVSSQENPFLRGVVNNPQAAVPQAANVLPQVANVVPQAANVIPQAANVVPQVPVQEQVSVVAQPIVDVPAQQQIVIPQQAPQVQQMVVPNMNGANAQDVANPVMTVPQAMDQVVQTQAAPLNNGAGIPTMAQLMSAPAITTAEVPQQVEQPQIPPATVEQVASEQAVPAVVTAETVPLPQAVEATPIEVGNVAPLVYQGTNQIAQQIASGGISANAEETAAMPEPPAAETAETPAVVSSSGKPIMHTFFSSLAPSSEAELLDVWKRTWMDAGWEVAVLSENDAKKNANYAPFVQAFDNAEFKLRDYDRLGFFKWLAMASSEGGWYSDYDTLPLNSRAKIDGTTLPNEGKLTVYSVTVPNLVSGSSEEWERMSKLFLSNYQFHSSMFWSDILALHEIHSTAGYNIDDSSIALGRIYVDELQSGEGVKKPMALSTKCQGLKEKRAIRFSFADCFSVGFCHNNRVMALKWLEQWKEKCAKHIEPNLRKKN